MFIDYFDSCFSLPAVCLSVWQEPVTLPWGPSEGVTSLK